MKRRQVVALTLALSPSLWAVTEPVMLTATQETLRANEPYRWSVYVTVPSGRASGVVIAPRAYATAGHVVFNESTLGWSAASSIYGYWGNHNRVPPLLSRQAGASIYRWDSYRTRATKDGSSSGASSIDTFNLDFAVVRVADPLIPDGSFAPAMVDDPGNPSFIRQYREKTIVGYPADQDYVPIVNIGKMHQNAPGFYDTFWWGDDEDPLDSGGEWIATQYFSEVVTWGGNSGGPVYVKDNAGRWLLNAVLVGGSIEDSTVRGLDAAAWTLVEAAAEASGDHPLRRVEALLATPATDGVELAWVDRSSGETGYRVERRGANEFEVLAELPPDAAGYLDATAAPGMAYQYRVQPFDANNSVAPPSPIAAIEVPGALAADYGRALGDPLLYFHTLGDAPVAIEGDDIVTGKVWTMESSALALELIGPGQLTYTWSVSSEANPDYNDPQSNYFGEIYDAIYCFLDDVQQSFLSGEEGPVQQVLNIPAGPHTIRWEYRKDPYSDEGEDRGRLQALTWTPSGTEAVAYGARRVDQYFQEASWFGKYTIDELPWIYHTELGWLYLSPVDQNGFWVYSLRPELKWLYVSAQDFPAIYCVRTKSWLSYARGTGKGGRGAWFYDYKAKAWFRIPL